MSGKGGADSTGGFGRAVLNSTRVGWRHLEDLDSLEGNTIAVNTRPGIVRKQEMDKSNCTGPEHLTQDEIVKRNKHIGQWQNTEHNAISFPQ